MTTTDRDGTAWMTAELARLRAEVARLTAEREAARVALNAGLGVGLVDAAKALASNEYKLRSQARAAHALAEAAQRDMRERAAAIVRCPYCKDGVKLVADEPGGPKTYHPGIGQCVPALIRALPLATPTLDAVEEQAMRRALEWAWEQCYGAAGRITTIHKDDFTGRGLTALRKGDA